MAQTRERSLITVCPNCGQQTVNVEEVGVPVDQGPERAVWKQVRQWCVNGDCSFSNGDLSEDSP